MRLEFRGRYEPVVQNAEDECIDALGEDGQREKFRRRKWGEYMQE